MRQLFRLSGASVPGSDHVQPGKPVWKNNQDDYFLCQGQNFSLAVVADGCGSGTSSEVGAKIGARLFGQSLALAAESYDIESGAAFPGWDRATLRTVSQISELADAMGTKRSKTVEEFFLFSLIGFCIMKEKTYVFHCGDGSYVVNGEMTRLGPYPNNAPPYLAYKVLNPLSEVGVRVVEYETSEIRTLAVATDGSDHVPDFEATLAQWFSTDATFSNPDGLRRRLALLNRERVSGGLLIPGPLKDDTTLALARRVSSTP